MPNLLDVDQALEQILDEIRVLSSEEIHLNEALGRVLTEDMRATINLPPFANSAMDGYAVQARDVKDADIDSPVRLDVVMDIPAGVAPAEPINSGQAARIMTGAPLPEGADAVVPVEDTDGNWGKGEQSPLSNSVAIFKSVPAGTHIRPAGENIAAGDLVLKAGTLLRPQEIGILAALGQAHIRVFRRPRVAILTNGDELVTVEEELAPGKIRDVNTYTLAGLVESCGGEAIRLPIAGDTAAAIRDLFQTALDHQPDMMISSAGVSVGAVDLIRTLLEELGQVDFWRINLRPGKPLAFGKLRGVPFFGLPGNPVSAMVTFDVLVRPALLKQGGRSAHVPIVSAVLGEDMDSDGRRSYIRVKLVYEGQQLVARSTGTQSSGALMSMVLADGLLIIPENVTHVSAGTTLQVRLLRQPDSDVPISAC